MPQGRGGYNPPPPSQYDPTATVSRAVNVTVEKAEPVPDSKKSAGIDISGESARTYEYSGGKIMVVNPKSVVVEHAGTPQERHSIEDQKSVVTVLSPGWLAIRIYLKT
jgi:hypothetical protein